jgi:ATP-binding cassette, subfamily B, bacterial HlyB/CyaB
VRNEFSQEKLTEFLTKMLGNTLLEGEFNNCLNAIKIIKPAIAKEFWNSQLDKFDNNASHQTGIFIVLNGKVRILDLDDNLIASLTAGASFGEMSLFPQEEFMHYSARASRDLQVAYISISVIQPLINKYPGIGDRLLKASEIFNFLQQHRSYLSQIDTSGMEGFLKAVNLCERHSFETGSLESNFFDENKLFFLKSGQIQDSQGNEIVQTNINQNKNKKNWHIVQPSIIYTLSKQNWNEALAYCPQLELFPDSNRKVATEDKTTNNKQIRKKRDFPEESRGKIIPFPQQSNNNNNKNKKESKKKFRYFPSPKVAVGQSWGKLTQKYPFFAQQSATDCGAACLVMIGRYWGKNFSLNRLRDLANVSRDGASLRAIAAGADEFIQRLPMGYETEIGEGGGLLSGGQRQRLAIARALLGNPRFILLDEATSSLDSESERIIQSNLKKILQGRTSLIIAHRLSTVRNADLILVLDKGVLVEKGNHDELIAKKGHYYYLNQQQLAG